MELREVDPRTLRFNPNNPRRTKASEHDEAQLLASVREFGVLQPPLVAPVEVGKKGKPGLQVVAGERRVRAAVAAETPLIHVLVRDAVDTMADSMTAVTENLVRADMGPVDRWRAMESLAGAGWTDTAIAGALNLTPRGIAQLRLLAHICPPMLDRMAQGDMPGERELRVIAAAPAAEQAEVWKRHKPKQTERTDWWAIHTALHKRRLSAADAKFGADEATAFGIVWEEDLFAPAGQDSRTTTQVDAFLEAQRTWLEANLPPGGSVVETSEYGSPRLPKGAIERYGKAASDDDLVAFSIHPQTGAIRETFYAMPRLTRPTGDPATSGTQDAPAAPARPDVTQKGVAMIGDLRTEALHGALRAHAIDDHALLGLLVLAMAGRNVEVRSGVDHRGMAGYGNRGRIAARLVEGGVLATDPKTLRDAAREMLVEALSCREGMSNSGVVARHAGAAVDADVLLPNMATEEFLSCLSKAALGAAAAGSDVATAARVKDTRAALVGRFKEATWIYPGARFAPTETELRVGGRLAEDRYRTPVPGGQIAVDGGEDDWSDDADETDDGNRHGNGWDDEADVAGDGGIAVVSDPDAGTLDAAA